MCQLAPHRRRPWHRPPAAGQGTRERAEAAAAALLSEFVPPRGARGLAGPPDLPGGCEQHPQSILVSNSMLDQAAFWEAPVTGHQLPGLDNYPDVDRQILAIASLPWKLPNP